VDLLDDGSVATAPAEVVASPSAATPACATARRKRGEAGFSLRSSDQPRLDAGLTVHDDATRPAFARHSLRSAEAAREPQNAQHEQQDPGRRPPDIPVARVAPTAAAQRQDEKHNKEHEQHEVSNPVNEVSFWPLRAGLRGDGTLSEATCNHDGYRCRKVRAGAPRNGSRGVPGHGSTREETGPRPRKCATCGGSPQVACRSRAATRRTSWWHDSCER